MNQQECEKESTITEIFAQTKCCKQYVKLIPNYDAYSVKLFKKKSNEK